MKIVISVIFLSLFQTVFGQIKGVFVYQMEWLSPDSNKVVKTTTTKIFTNDTIVRVETPTESLGNQVYIRHMSLNKAYLLLEIGQDKYAIQTVLEDKKSDTVKVDYTFKKTFGSKRIAGYRCKKYEIRFKSDSTKVYYGYFAKKIPNKYLEVYQKIPGLALEYTLPSSDGPLHYKLITLSKENLDRNLFGISMDYKRISFDEFLDLMMKMQESEE